MSIHGGPLCSLSLSHSQQIGVAFKFAALQRVLAPNVKDRVMIGLDVSETGYEIALGRLEKYFGGPEKWTNAMLEALERNARLRPNDWTGARQFLDRVDAYASSSTLLAVDPNYDAVMMALIKRNVPEEWYPQFQTWCTLSGLQPNVRNFVKWGSALVDPHLRGLTHTRGRVHFTGIDRVTTR